MLVMKCPECQGKIVSDLLVELQVLTCPHCHQQVNVTDIQISANGMTYDRNDLVKRLFHYKKMLQETIAERHHDKSVLANQTNGRGKDKFVGALKGMMTGARNHYRHLFDQYAEAHVSFCERESYSRFVNLSLDGCCLLFDAADGFPAKGDCLMLDFILPDSDIQLKLLAKACWTQVDQDDSGQRKIVVGVVFCNISESDQKLLWDYICSVADRQNLAVSCL